MTGKNSHKNDKHKPSVKDWHEPIPDRVPVEPDTEGGPTLASAAEAIAGPPAKDERSTSAPIGLGQDASTLGSGQIPFGFGQAPAAAASAPKQS